jgi:pimeloyl-ACP methyl ester carboxylesterase
MKSRPKLVIVPGLGDDLMIYQVFARRWQKLGYEVHVISFGWAQKDARLRDKMDAFLARLDALGQDELYMIGVSAGGPAAINAFARRGNVRKVIAVCSPLNTMLSLRNPLLAESIEQTRQLLLHFNDEQKARILSAFALRDSTVHTTLSRPAGIKTLRIPMVVHPAAIFVALMFYAHRLNVFLRK